MDGNRSRHCINVENLVLSRRNTVEEKIFAACSGSASFHRKGSKGWSSWNGEPSSRLVCGNASSHARPHPCPPSLAHVTFMGIESGGALHFSPSPSCYPKCGRHRSTLLLSPTSTSSGLWSSTLHTGICTKTAHLQWMIYIYGYGLQR